MCCQIWFSIKTFLRITASRNPGRVDFLLGRGQSLDVIYVNFAKATDSVRHKGLPSKVHSYGIRGNCLNWVEQFLSGRKQCVVLSGFKSPWSNVLSGVPEGSVLGHRLGHFHS